MSNRFPTADANPPRTPPANGSTLGAVGWFIIIVALGMIVGVSLFLAPQWRHNPDLSHGWFTPLVFLLLMHEARLNGTPRFLQSGKLVSLTLVGALVLGMLLLTASGLYMAALDWTHSLVASTVTASLCAFLVATLLAMAGEDVRFVPFNWAAGVAIFLWLLSAPLPPGTYATLTHTLQSAVTSVVLGLLHFLGIAAVRHGNIIQLTNVTVGVEEACSGVRSLVSCIYAGLFFSAALVRRPWSRFWIIGLAAPLAVVMNILRSLTLTLLAHNGVEIRGAWHDFTGYAILAVTAGFLAGLAILLERRVDKVSTTPRQPDSVSPTQASVRPARGPLLWVASGQIAALGIILLFVLNTRPAEIAGRPAPDLTALLPDRFAGWDVVPSEELFLFSDQLKTTHLAQNTYHRQSTTGDLEITVYLAYWPAGKVPVSLVASHTPDACWPGSGWVVQPVNASRAPLLLRGRALEDAEQRLFTLQGHTQHVWYWHVYDGRVIHPDNVRSPRKLLLLAWRYGFHREGEQLFVRVSSNRPWEKIASEPLLQEIFARLAPFGL